jgi:ATP-dependent DNA helicase RecG
VDTLEKKQAASKFGLRGIGPQTAEYLAKLNIFSLQDFLFHFPSRYQDRTQIHSISVLIPDREAVVEGQIKNISMPKHGRTKLLCELHDGSGIVFLRFFHVFSFQTAALKVGMRLRCYGSVQLHNSRSGLRSDLKEFEMMHPEFQIIEEGKDIPLDSHLTSIYPATQGLSQNKLRKLMLNALAAMEAENHFYELLPASLLQSLSLPTFKEALQFLHRPPNTMPVADLLAGKTSYQRRLIFEELLTHRLSLLQVKQSFQSQKSVVFVKEEKLIEQFLANLPFLLTKAQERVTQEIKNDLSRSFPMLRLVQGDVGAGKTVVAALAMLRAVEGGYQAAMMAPTELLAEQHYRVFKHWFEPLGIKLAFLSGRVKGQARETVLENIITGEAQIILGTHALFQAKVEFACLALVVIDEQHRFGVQQRALLQDKGSSCASMLAASCLKPGTAETTEQGAVCYPHQLIMTATPIPRTLAMSLYADLDCSILDELPPGRTPITTSVIANARRDEVADRVSQACQQGRQVYWVCPLIDESEANVGQSVIKTAAELQTRFPELKIGLVHGRMRAEDKDGVMQAFQRSEIQVLVATTVIEVGVDVANASVMVIENAQSLGLSQLHQLRGRVGRGSVASHCILLYQQPLSEIAAQRLTVMRETNDGFKIAQRDLELRGPGEILGTKQTGEWLFRIADLIRDSDILPQIQQAAEFIMREHSDIVYPLLTRWLGEGQVAPFFPH